MPRKWRRTQQNGGDMAAHPCAVQVPSPPMQLAYTPSTEKLMRSAHTVEALEDFFNHPLSCDIVMDLQKTNRDVVHLIAAQGEGDQDRQTDKALRRAVQRALGVEFFSAALQSAKATHMKFDANLAHIILAYFEEFTSALLKHAPGLAGILVFTPRNEPTWGVLVDVHANFKDWPGAKPFLVENGDDVFPSVVQAFENVSPPLLPEVLHQNPIDPDLCNPYVTVLEAVQHHAAKDWFEAWDVAYVLRFFLETHKKNIFPHRLIEMNEDGKFWIAAYFRHVRRETPIKVAFLVPTCEHTLFPQGTFHVLLLGLPSKEVPAGSSYHKGPELLVEELAEFMFRATP